MKNLVPVLSGLVMVSGLVIGTATVHADDNINSENNAAITYGGLSSSSGSSASTDNTLNTSVAQDVEEVPSDSTGSITDSTGGNITETNSSTPSTDSAPMYTFDGEGTDVYRHTVNNLISDQGTVDVTPVEYINDVDDENATFKYDVTFAPVQSSNHIETVNGLVIAVPEHATNLTVQVLGYASKTGEVVRLETPITLDNADETAAREAYANGETYEYPEENGYTGALVYKGLSTDPESAAEITPEARVKYYGLAPSYSFFEKELRTLALAVSYDVPTEIAKKQPYQPIYTSALAWKLNEEGSFGSYEEGGLSLQEYSWAQDPDALSYVQDPSKIGPNDFDRDGLKSQKDVGVTAYTGEFAIVGQDVTVPTESITADDGTILTNNYVSTFNLRSNVGVDYYISETEDMADIAVSTYKVNNLIEDQGSVDVTPLFVENEVDADKALYSYQVSFAPVQSSNKIETNGGLMFAIPENATEVTVEILGYVKKSGEVVTFDQPMTVPVTTGTLEGLYDNGYTSQVFKMTGPETNVSNDSVINEIPNVQYYGLAPSYTFYENDLRTLGFTISYKIPTEDAVANPNQPLYASALSWKANEAGTFGSYEEGAQSLQSYSWAKDPDALSYVADPSKIQDGDFDQDGLKVQKDVGVTAYTGTWSEIGQDVTVPEESYTDVDGTQATNNYVREFDLRSNYNVTYFVSRTEDLADIAVSTYNLVVREATWLDVPVVEESVEEAWLDVPVVEESIEEDWLDVPVIEESIEEDWLDVPVVEESIEEDWLDVPVVEESTEEDWLDVPVVEELTEEDWLDLPVIVESDIIDSDLPDNKMLPTLIVNSKEETTESNIKEENFLILSEVKTDSIENTDAETIVGSSKQAVLPRTGETTSAMTVLGFASLLAAFGFVKRRKEE